MTVERIREINVEKTVNSDILDADYIIIVIKMIKILKNKNLV